MADVPFLGCKISLISKCDIRYEGILYCVDAKESTIALSKVRSYGTETRGDPSHYVAPKNDVYDIIIFRASDVKDLRVDAPEPPGLTDPAIISAHHSYSGQSPSTSSFNNNTTSTTNTTTAAASTTTTATNLNNNATNSSSSSAAAAVGTALNSNGSLPISGPSNQQQKQQHQKPLLPFLPTGSLKDQQQLPTINYSSAVANNAQRRARAEPRDKRSSGDQDTNSKKQTHDLNRENNRRDDRRNENRRGDDRRQDDNRRHERRNDDRNENRRSGDDGLRRRGSERRDDGGRRGGGGGDSHSNVRMSRGGYDTNRNHNHVNSSSNMRYNNSNNYNSRRGPSSRDNNSKGGGAPMYRRGPMHGGGRRARSGDRTGAPRGPRKGAPLKFDGEYDFDEANKLFLELEGKFKGMKLKGGEGEDGKDGGESSGDGVTSKSPAGQSESGSGYDSDQNNKDGDSKDEYGESVSGEFYDKTKSFFDNISCEASERSQGKVNKPDWRKERQINTETFGVSANYRRGGYRGRVYGTNGYHRR